MPDTALGYGRFSVIADGTETLIEPPYMQRHFDVEFSAGMFASKTVGAPGIHGDDVIGVQGPGVSTPRAAAVSVAVAGLLKDAQTPKGAMLTNGLWSMMFAIGLFSAFTRLTGSTLIGAGAAPNEHIS